MTKNIRKLERMIASIKKIASDGPEAVTPEERLSAMEFVDVRIRRSSFLQACRDPKVVGTEQRQISPTHGDDGVCVIQPHDPQE